MKETTNNGLPLHRYAFTLGLWQKARIIQLLRKPHTPSQESEITRVNIGVALSAGAAQS